MNSWTIFESLLAVIRAPILGAVDTMVTALTGQVGNVIRVGLTLWIAWKMLAYAFSPEGSPLTLMTRQMIAGAAAFLVASQAAVYNQYVTDLFLTRLGTELSSLLSNQGGKPIEGRSFDEIWNTAYVAGLNVEKQLSAWGDFLMHFLVLAYWLASVVVITFSFALWMGTALGLALFVGLGPIFVGMFPFPALRPIFDRWLQGMIGFVVLQVFVTALLVILIQAETVLVNQIAAGAGGNAVLQGQMLLAGIILFLVAGLVLKRLPDWSSSLTSGVCAHAPHVFEAMASVGAGAVAMTGSAAKAAGNAMLLPTTKHEMASRPADRSLSARRNPHDRSWS